MPAPHIGYVNGSCCTRAARIMRSLRACRSGGDLDVDPSNSDIARDHCGRAGRAQSGRGRRLPRGTRFVDGPGLHPADTLGRDGVSRSRLRRAPLAADPRRDSRERRCVRVELPGLFDLQVNGFAGVDFNAPDLIPDRAAQALDAMRATGVTRCLPTLITSALVAFAAAARVLSRLDDPAVARIHMEGPYISPHDGARGAHPRSDVIPASLRDCRRRQDAADGRIVLVTLAAEVDGALPLIEYLAASGVRAAIGHTAAQPQQIADALPAGPGPATHLGNRGAPRLARAPPPTLERLAAAHWS